MILFALLLSQFIFSAEDLRDQILHLEIKKRVLRDLNLVLATMNERDQKISQLSNEIPYGGILSAQQVMKNVCEFPNDGLIQIVAVRVYEKEHHLPHNILTRAQYPINQG